MIDLSHRQQILILLLSTLLVFFVWAKIDASHIFGDVVYDLGVIKVPFGWFWMWVIGYPVFAFVLALAYYTGAPDTERNFWYAVGIFMTVMLLAIGQLEDFLWHVANGFSFPTGDWSTVGWTRENNIFCWLFGTWTTPMHFLWFGSFVALVVAMWVIILEWA